jgi:YD repeat-containing protein
VSTSQVSYTYKAVRASAGTLIEPTEVLAPHASELSCSPTLNKGCRALVLKYAETTTASGEAESQWGQYEARLKEVLFAAYNPTSAKVEEKTVAQYAYDGKGRLRAEWDPRIKPELKTVYGYDAEGHVTAISPPGQEPWLIHYGTIPTDASAGRALSVTRPAAATAIGSRTAPANVIKPKLSSTTPTVGIQINLSSNGTWANEPLAYSYQWQDCNSAGAECAAILGAVNESYYPAASDEGHTLKLQVSAVNAGGATIATSSATSLVKTGTPYSPAPEPPSVGTGAVTTVEYGVPVSGSGLPNLSSTEAKKWGQEDDPVEGTAVFPPYKPMGWPAKEYTAASLVYFDAEGRTVNSVNPSGGVSTTEYNASNNAVRTLSADNRATAIGAGAKSAEVAANLDDRSVYNEEGDELLETLGPEHRVKLASGTEVQARHRVKYYYDEGSPEGKEYRRRTADYENVLLGTERSRLDFAQADVRGQRPRRLEYLASNALRPCHGSCARNAQGLKRGWRHIRWSVWKRTWRGEQVQLA